MRWISVATRTSWDEDSARTVPIPWERLAKIVRPKGGNTGVVIAAPGVGKTTMLLNWVRRSGAKTLYCSMDTSPMDVTAQMAAMVTGHQRVVVERRMMESEDWRREYSSAVYQEVPNFVVDFTPSLSVSKIGAMAESLTELWGETPEMIVIDTASNLDIGEMGENANWQKMWKQAQELAREFNSFVVLAHHVKSGPVKSGTIAPELSDGLWGCEQFPEIVLGLHLPTPTEVICSVLKNRSGKARVGVKLAADYAVAQVNDAEKVAT